MRPNANRFLPSVCSPSRKCKSRANLSSCWWLFPDIIPASMSSSRASSPSPLRLQAVGLLLFLFIPLVLFLFVRHPEPVGMSLGAGVILMIGHRRLARPYMRRALPWKCLWCNRVLPEEGGETVELRGGAETLPAGGRHGPRDPRARGA